MDHSKEDSPEIVERRMEDALKRALATPHSPHKKSAEAKRGAPKAK